MEEVARRLIVSGRVQGVFFRAWTVETARALGIRGWVRNRRDGTVEIVANGSQEKISELAERCRTGPENARVDSVDMEEIEPFEAPGFAQAPTA
ncbi:acylphosphatase [Stakelama saccharophila]|uniref:Acylphosphatase n=1 Tax=Stakelama saccharophila TaxID=3075605 RepID=A0ABZ0B7B2_9SPHN|nr:acylphosphatase [Stakelama sp. W311]WNO52885.1 acylphosphatase [Stakelama sp. W311]